MAQMAIYLEDKLVERLDKALKPPGKSKSRWVADAIEYVLQAQWPKGFFDLAGKWQDDVGPAEIMNQNRSLKISSSNRPNGPLYWFCKLFNCSAWSDPNMQYTRYHGLISPVSRQGRRHLPFHYRGSLQEQDKRSR